MLNYLSFSEAVSPKELIHGEQPVDENLDGIAGNGSVSRFGKEKKWHQSVYNSASR
jgi:hypothetical protein